MTRLKTRLDRVSGYQVILGWLVTVCALAVAGEIWPELDRLVTSLSEPSLYLGLALAAGYLGWTAWSEIWTAHRRRKASGQRGPVRR